MVSNVGYKHCKVAHNSRVRRENVRLTRSRAGTIWRACPLKDTGEAGNPHISGKSSRHWALSRPPPHHLLVALAAGGSAPWKDGVHRRCRWCAPSRTRRPESVQTCANRRGRQHGHICVRRRSSPLSPRPDQRHILGRRLQREHERVQGVHHRLRKRRWIWTELWSVAYGDGAIYNECCLSCWKWLKGLSGRCADYLKGTVGLK